MKKMTCMICGKKVYEKDATALQITYHIPESHLYMTTHTFCIECNTNIVKPTIKSISETLKLDYQG